MADVVLSVRGDKAVMRQLAGLPRALQRKVLSRCARIAMKPMLAAARSAAPKASGALRKGIKLRALKKNRRGQVGVLVGVGEKWFVGDQFYGAFQEFGWHVGKRTNAIRKGTAEDTRTWIEGQHYLEHTYRAHGVATLRIFMAEVPREIERQLSGGKP